MLNSYNTNNNYKISTIFLLSSAGALIFAYILQYVFNMLPCKLCTYERVVYYVIGLLSLICMLKKDSKILIYAVFCSYIVGAVISFYHIGIEFHWFHDVLGCTEQASGNVSIEELKSNLLNPDYSPSCDRPYYIFGISIATWNFIYSLLVLLIAGKTYADKKKPDEV